MVKEGGIGSLVMWRGGGVLWLFLGKNWQEPPRQPPIFDGGVAARAKEVNPLSTRF
jgi:hypothetical protein